MARFARFTDSAQAFGELMRPNSMVVYGGLPQIAGDIREKFEIFVAGGEAIEPDTPPPALVLGLISDCQFFQQLAIDGVISEEEAEAAGASGTIPTAMLALIDELS